MMAMNLIFQETLNRYLNLQIRWICWEETELKRLLILMTALFFVFSCSGKKDSKTDDEFDDLSDEALAESEVPDTDTDDYDFLNDGPKPPDWGDCKGVWEQKEQFNEETGRLEARWCEPPENWRPAAPPDWGDCPDGWEQKEDKDEDGNLLARYCEPILPPVGTECEPGFFAMFGAKKCQRIGDSCPEGEFADIPNDAGTEIIYVSEGESIQEAIDKAKDGAVIAIGKGTFDEFVTITDKSITLWGACVEETTIKSSIPGESHFDGIINVVSQNDTKKITVKNLTVTGRRTGIYIGGSSNAVLENLAVYKTTGYGVFAFSEKRVNVEISNVSVKETLSREEDKTRGIGIIIRDNVNVNMNRVSVEKNKMVGIVALSFSSSTQVKFEGKDIIVSNTMPRESDDNWGRGVLLEDNVEASLDRVLIEKSRQNGLSLISSTPGSKVVFEASRLIIRDTLSQKSDKQYGAGIEIQNNVTASISKIIVERNRNYGISAGTFDDSSIIKLDITDGVIRDTMSQENDKNNGSGVLLQNNVESFLARVLISGNRNTGLSAGTLGNSEKVFLTGEDLTIIETQSQESDKNWGKGISIEDNVVAKLSNILIEKNRHAGISVATFLDETFSEIEAQYTVVRNTRSQEQDNKFGTGIQLIENVNAIFSGILIENNRFVGFIASNTSSEKQINIKSEDFIVRGTLSQESDNKLGLGIVMQNNINADFSRLLSERNRVVGISAGIYTSESKISVKLEDMIVFDTFSQAEDKIQGYGVFFGDNIHGEISKALVDRNRDMGMLIINDNFDPSIIKLKNTTISNTRIRECYELGLQCLWAPEAPFGHGIGVYDGSVVEMINVSVDNNHNGVQIKNGMVFAGENCALSSFNNDIQNVCLYILNNQTGINAFELDDEYNIREAFAGEKTDYVNNEIDYLGDHQPIAEPPDPPDVFGNK